MTKKILFYFLNVSSVEMINEIPNFKMAEEKLAVFDRDLR